MDSIHGVGYREMKPRETDAERAARLADELDHLQKKMDYQKSGDAFGGVCTSSLSCPTWLTFLFRGSLFRGALSTWSDPTSASTNTSRSEVSMEKKAVNGLWALAIGMFIFTPAGVVLRAFAISKMWLWYVVPLGVHAIGTIEAAGLSVFLSMLMLGIIPNVSNLAPKKGVEEKSPIALVVEQFSTQVFTTLAFLYAGWVLQQL